MVIPPATLTPEEKVVSLACLISRGRTQPSSQLSTVQYVVNVMISAVHILRPTAGQFTSIKVNIKTPNRDEYMRWTGAGDDPTAALPDGYPTHDGEVAEEARAITRLVAAYAGVSTLLFAIGKQPTDAAGNAQADICPDELICRFNLADEEQLLLPNRAAGPIPKTLEMIYNSLATYPEMRNYLVRHFIAIRNYSSFLPIEMDILMTSFKLMHNSGMTHMAVILEMGHMHPWALRVPELKRYFQKFVDELRRFEAVPANIRPYHRLVVNQDQYFFIYADYRPLIAVARWITEKSFREDTTNSAEYAELIERVCSHAPRALPHVSSTSQTSHCREET